jgi:soluble lytic murein transglycosylase
MKFYQVVLTFLIVFGTSNLVLGNHAIYSRSEINVINKTVKYIDDGQIDAAKSEAQKLRDPVILKAIDWLCFLGSKEVNFEKAVENFNKFKNWPRIEELKRSVENSINEKTDINLAFKWFSVHKPSTDKAALKYLNLIARTCNKNNCRMEERVKNLWLSVSFCADKQEIFLKSYGSYLNSSDYRAKLEKLMWEKKYDRAASLIKYVGPEYQKLYNARFALIAGNGKIENIIAHVPMQLRKNNGLLHDILVAYEKSKDEENLYRLISRVQESEAHLEVWWPFKNRHIRSLIEKKQYNIAYSLTSNHKMRDHQLFAETEWLAGWIALRYLHKPLIARSHFNRMFNVSKMPISMAKATYWIARTYEAEGNTEHAKMWYEKAAQRITTFYGQLAAQKIAKVTHFSPKSGIKITAQDVNNYRNNIFARLAIFFMNYREGYLAKDFIIKALNDSKSNGERYLIIASGVSNNRMDLSVMAAKEASAKKLIIPEFLYPLKKINNTSLIPSAFIYGLIRQESLFHVAAQSPVGALGLMQIMPKTGESLAKALGIRFNVKKLHLDSEYNTKFGIHYLTTLAKMFDGSYILSAAAYNAGPKNALKWINRFGDPRKMTKVDDVVDWLESITFPETRNYVQRILESMQIYRHILNFKSDVLIVNTARDILYTSS